MAETILTDGDGYVAVPAPTPPTPPPLNTMIPAQPSDEKALGLPSTFGFYAAQSGAGLANYGIPVDETINQ